MTDKPAEQTNQEGYLNLKVKAQVRSRYFLFNVI